MAIQTRIEPERGCGYRRKGFYIMGGKTSTPCCLLPIELLTCSHCDQEIKFTRGFQWANKYLLLQWATTKACVSFSHRRPPPENGFAKCVDHLPNRIGLMWVGQKFYPTPAHFIRESNAIGVSKRVGKFPKDLKVGDWVALAHSKAICITNTDEMKFKPGIFMLFKVTEFNYVVDGTETAEEILEHEAKGITCVEVIAEGEQPELFTDKPTIDDNH